MSLSSTLIKTFRSQLSRSELLPLVQSITPFCSETGIDPIQKMLLAEECILLDKDDKAIGHDSKKNCHLVLNGDLKLHRAFSVFLFDTKGKLLLQKRSAAKVTFPSMWTNTCCSHPLYVPEEMNEEKAMGVKVAARRRLQNELGIEVDEVPLSAFNYLTRIHYKALSDSVWGEHEIDYILFVQKDVNVKANPNEVEEIRYVTLNELEEMRRDEELSFTPWFKLILEKKLPLWWNNLRDAKKFEDHHTIHRM